jgi:class 3 adenylate cyclase
MTAVATQLVGSVLFTDLVGFTAFNDVRGDVAAVRVLDRQGEVIDSVLARYPGTRLVKELGDGSMVWSPTAPGALGSATVFAAGIRAAREHDGYSDGGRRCSGPARRDGGRSARVGWSTPQGSFGSRSVPWSS